MPTKLDRVQVLFQKDLFKKIKLLAKVERRSLSSMVGSLVEYAIESKKYKSALSQAINEDLKIKLDKAKLNIDDIFNPSSLDNIEFDVNSKLEKIDQILASIRESNEIKVNNLVQRENP